MTNERGLQLAVARETSRRLALAEIGEPDDRDTRFSGVTLGAFRRGKNMPWVPGVTIDVWTACAGTEQLTGHPSWPHAYFIQTLGGGRPEDGSIHCPGCRTELKRRRDARSKPAMPIQGSLF